MWKDVFDCVEFTLIPYNFFNFLREVIKMMITRIFSKYEKLEDRDFSDNATIIHEKTDFLVNFNVFSNIEKSLWKYDYNGHSWPWRCVNRFFWLYNISTCPTELFFTLPTMLRSLILSKYKKCQNSTKTDKNGLTRIPS